MLDELKQQVYNANIELVTKGLVIYTWGNVSGVDRENNIMVIKPSGVDYDCMGPEDMVMIDLISGKSIDSRWLPSSDTKTHLELYRKYNSIGGVVHTHSVNAVAFAQAGRSIPALGTTHADYFYGDIPCTRKLSEKEIFENYESNTGKVIIETLEKEDIDTLSVPGIVVCSHGPFAWGKTPRDAVYHAVVMEPIRH